MGDAGGGDLSPPVLVALAFRLTEAALVHAGHRPFEATDEVHRVARLVEREPPGYDPIVALDAVTESLRLAPGLFDALALLSRAVIDRQDGMPVLRRQEGAHAVTRVICPDSLVLHRLAGRCVPGSEGEVDLGWSPTLGAGLGLADSVMRKPIAERHLHLGGALPPVTLWIIALTDEGWSFGGDGQPGWLRGLDEQLKVARRLLVRLDPHYESSSAQDIDSTADALRAQLQRETPLDVAPGNGDVEGYEGWPYGGERVDGGLTRALLLAERRRVLSALVHARSPRRTELASALIAYLCLKHAFHWSLLHQPGGRGLSRFRRSFSRRAFAVAGVHPPARRMEIERLRMGVVIESAIREALPAFERAPADARPPLEIEVRAKLSLGDRLRPQLWGWLGGIRDALLSFDAPPSVAVGLIFQLSKRAADAELDGPFGGLVDLLVESPWLRPLIVGIDAAGDELAASPRRYSRIYHQIRRRLDEQPVAGHLSHRLSHLMPGFSAPPPVHLGFTFHAGEDFRDLLTGVRHVDEAAHLLGLRRSRDRIGHALALAWSPEAFYARRGRSYPRAADHALDLVWCSALLETDRVMQAELLHRLNRTFDLDLTPAALDRVGRMAAISGGRAPAHPDETLLREIGLTPERHDMLIEVRGTPRWSGLVRRVQALVRSRVEERDLALEICPTSNVLVGGFHSHVDLPYLSLHPCDTSVDGPRLPLIVCTDDPGVFATNLRDEYHRMADALHANGHPVSQIKSWLESARETSVERGFIPEWAPRGAELVRYINRLTDDWVL